MDDGIVIAMYSEDNEDVIHIRYTGKDKKLL